MIPAPTPPSGESAPPSLEERIAATELEAFRQQNQTPPEALEARLRETTLEGLLMEFVRQSECVWDTVHDHIQLLKGGEKRLDLEGEAAERLWNVWAGTHPPIVLVEKVARLAAEIARLTAELEDHGPDGRNVTNAQHQAMRERALAAEARAARLEEAHAVLAAFARTAPGCLPERVQSAVDLAPWDGALYRALRNPEGADR